MAKFTLPPSPNWQLSNVLSSNDAGVVAYGSRGELNIIKVEGEKSFKVSVLALAHKEKLNVVTFSPSSGSFKNCIATGGDDAVVRVWDFLKNISLYFHSGHNVSKSVWQAQPNLGFLDSLLIYLDTIWQAALTPGLIQED